MMKKQYSRPKVMVGTVKKVHGRDCLPVIAQESQPAFAWLWFSRRFAHPPRNRAL
jgi:hypothetical protein